MIEEELRTRTQWILDQVEELDPRIVTLRKLYEKIGYTTIEDMDLNRYSKLIEIA